MWFKTIFRRNPKRGTLQLGKQRANAQGRFVADEALLRRLERLGLVAQQTLRGTPASGEHTSRQQLPTTIFSDHRPYSVGDDYRYVDWNAYARHDQVVIKLGEAEQSVNVHLLLDASRSMSWGVTPKLVAAQHLVAALGFLALTHSDRLRITPFGAAPLPAFGPAQGKGRAIDMLRFLGGVAAQEQTDLAGVLDGYARRNERGGMLILCSDLLSDASEALAQGLRRLRPPHWQVLVLHLVDPAELAPDLRGSIELEDSETGQRLPLTLDAQALQTYQHNLEAWQASIRAACAHAGASYAQVRTDWPLERAVVPYLRARQILR